jgi:ribosomal protein L32
MIFQQLVRWTTLLGHHFSLPFIRQSACRPLLIPSGPNMDAHAASDVLDWLNGLWLAVPKKKVSKSKKRMKTTAQKRIKLKQNIITDPRTGETTLRHKLPLRWKDYLPKVE